MSSHAKIETATISLFEMKCVTDFTSKILIPIESYFIPTDRNIRLRYQKAGESTVTKLNTTSRVATAELLETTGIIAGFKDLGNDEVYMYNWLEIPDGNLTIMVKSQVLWEDIKLEPYQVQEICALYEYQETIYEKMRMIKKSILSLFVRKPKVANHLRVV